MTEINVEVRRTINLGDYNSVSYQFGVRETVPEGKKTSEHLVETKKRLEKLLAKELLEDGIVTED